jgi:4-amino-4-deoxy-L-arabinose transferase-like glycosyltransferase
LAEPRRCGGLQAWWLLALGLVIPAAAGGIAIFERFDGLYGQDAFAYFDYATGPFRHSFLHLHRPPPFFWPPGYPFVVALASLVVGRTPLAGQLVSLAAGALVPVFTALLAHELWPVARRKARFEVSVPLIAGLLVACNGQLWQSSVVVMADTVGLAAATAGVWALARYGREGRLRWLLLAAALVAAATMTRWIYGVVAVPCALFGVWVAVRRYRRMALWHAAAAAILATAVLTPVIVGDRFHGNFEVYGWSPLRIFDRTFATADGTLGYRLPTGLYYAVAPARWAYFTPFLALLILPGAWAVIRRRAAAPALLLLGWAAAVYVFHAGSAYQNFRFTLAYLPPLAILAGIGAQQVVRLLAVRRFAVAIAAAAFAFGLAVMAAAGAHTTRYLIARKNDSVAVVRWTDARLPPGARLVTFNLTATFRHYSRVETYDLFEQNPARLRALVASRPPVFLLVDVPSIQRQWRDRSPGENLRWLERGPGLTALGAEWGFTLFRVGTRAER